MTEYADMIWNVDMEVNLFHAIRGHKPAGVNKHFQMISIHERLSSGLKKLTSKDVWERLSSLYDLRALNESELVPFPNDAQNEFDLNEDELKELCQKSFPRSSYIDDSAQESGKDSLDKGTPKSSKQDSKLSLQSQPQKVDNKQPNQSSRFDSKVTTSSNKPDNKPSSTNTPINPSNKCSTANSNISAVKTPQAANSTVQLISSGAFEPSPKRAKRTRNTPTSNNSPATPSEPPQKRRR